MPVYSATTLARLLLDEAGKGADPVRLRLVSQYADGRLFVERKGKAIQASSATEAPLKAGNYVWCIVRDNTVVVLGQA